MSTSTPSGIPTATPSIPEDWIWHTSLSSTSPSRHISALETFIDNVFSGYICLMALLLPLVMLIFFLTPPDRGFRPREVNNTPIEEDSFKGDGIGRNDGDSDIDSMEGEADSGSDRDFASHGASPGSSSIPNARSNSGSGTYPLSHSDCKWDDSREEWTEAEQQQSAESCCPQYTA